MTDVAAAALLHLDRTLTTYWLETTALGTDILACRDGEQSRIRITTSSELGEIEVHRADPAGFPLGASIVLRCCPELVGAAIEALLQEQPAHDCD